MSQRVRALRHRNFRLFLGGQIISLAGTWMQQVALSWLVYRLTRSPFLLGLVGFAGQLPSLLLAPLAGVWADRADRRRIVIGTQAGATTWPTPSPSTRRSSTPRGWWARRWPGS